jgi:hypothetical protein
VRRVISILLIIFSSSLVLSAVRNLPLPQFANFSKEFDAAHAVTGGILVILLGIHIWLNRKPIVRYFRKLGWWWIPVGLGFAAVIWGGVIMTILLALSQ